MIETNRFFRCINERLRVTSPTSSSISSVGSSANLQSSLSGEGSVTSFLTQVSPPPQATVQSPLSPIVSVMQQSPPNVTSSSLQSSLQQAVSPSKPSGGLPLSSLHSPVPSSPPVHIMIRYIVCKDLFFTDTKERFVINTDPNTVTMKDLHNSIAMCVDVEEGFVLELFSHEGYPLCPNEFTFSCKLHYAYNIVLLLPSLNVSSLQLYTVTCTVVEIVACMFSSHPCHKRGFIADLHVFFFSSSRRMRKFNPL